MLFCITAEYTPQALNTTRENLSRDNKVGRSATRRMAGLAGFRVGIALS